MPEVSDNYRRIYDTVSQIPSGRVSSYGAVARFAGLPGHARQVGYAMAALPEDLEVPWHRVVNARGEVSRRRGNRMSERIQRMLLEKEGIEFQANGRIDLERFGWSPTLSDS